MTLSKERRDELGIRDNQWWKDFNRFIIQELGLGFDDLGDTIEKWDLVTELTELSPKKAAQEFAETVLDNWLLF